MARRLAALTVLVALAASPAFAATGSGAGWISPKDLRVLLAEEATVVIFDARGKREFDHSRIKGAQLPLPLQYYNDLSLFNAGVIPDRPDTRTFLRQSLGSLPKSTRIVTYCNRGCQASVALRDELIYMGFKDVRTMEEGFEAWADSGFPVERSGEPNLAPATEVVQIQ